MANLPTSHLPLLLLPKPFFHGQVRIFLTLQNRLKFLPKRPITILQFLRFIHSRTGISPVTTAVLHVKTCLCCVLSLSITATDNIHIRQVVTH